MRRLFLPLVIALSAPLAASSARADVTSPAPAFMPVPTALTLWPLFGEPTGNTVGLAPALAVLPLRLSLLGSAVPRASTLPGDPFHCESYEEASGNSQAGFPVEREVYLAMTSRLVLHGFSRLGCPVDARVGGGVTYTMPLARNVSIVPSAGAYARSSVAQGRVLTQGNVRVDLQLNTSSDWPLGIGVVKRGGRQGVQLTGTW